MEDFLDFTGQRFLVTGASSGMGEQIAVLLSHLRATVILTARREDNLRRITDSLEGEGHRYYPYDLVDVEGIERLINKIMDENGPLDGLVHSAGQGVARPLKMSTYHFMLALLVSLKYGVMAIAVSALICSFINILISAFFGYKYLGYSSLILLKDIMPAMLLSIIMGGLVALIPLVIQHSIACLTVQVIFGVAIYLGLSLATHNGSLRVCVNLFMQKKAK